MNIRNKVEKFLEKYNLLNSEDTFLVAFSGGYDSMCLLNICKELKLNVVAVHLNHNWRGEESKSEEDTCREFCLANNIKFYAETLPESISKTETAAREARYDFFEKCANKFQAKAIFTAHNSNDNAETILYRVAKGTGTFGLSGIAEKRDLYYRPLLNIDRKDIENYCLENSLKPNNDSSNTNVKYKRNLIRKNIIPELEKINPQVIESINSLSYIAKMDNEIINSFLKTLDNPFNTRNFTSYLESIQLRLIYNLFLENNLEYDKEKISRVLEFIHTNKSSKSGKTISLTKNLWLYVNTQKIEIVTKTPVCDDKIIITDCGKYEIRNKILLIEKFENEIKEFPKDCENIAYVDLSKFKELTIRFRKEGDKIKPLGNSGTQKLKKYLNEKKIPNHQKDELVLLASENEILWVASLGISEDIKVVTKPTHMLKLLDK